MSSSAARPKIAFFWLTSCGGCDEAIVDLGEPLLFEVAPRVEIVFWPVAIDAKYADLEAIEPGGIVASFVNGSARTQETADLARLIRDRSQVVIALGACAHMGGTAALANTSAPGDLLRTAYRDTPGTENPRGILPGGAGSRGLTPLTDAVHPLHELIEVDYYLPGCPPPPDLLLQAVTALLCGDLPPRGHVFGEEQALCHGCSRLASKPEELRLDRFLRVHELTEVTDECLLAQGLLCLGPATRGGCGERCIKVNMPCRGCFGPAAGVTDHAASILAFVTASAPVDSGGPGLQRYVESLVDPVGTCHRFGLPCELVQRK